MKYFLIIVSFVAFSFSGFSQDTLNVMFYNVLNYPQVNPTKADTLKPIVKLIKPDIFMITELTALSGANLILTDALNVDGVTHYQRATYFNGPDTDNMLYYNSNKLALKSQFEIATVLRNISEYVLYYNAQTLSPGDDTIFIYCYVAHLKASQGITNEQQRNQEVVTFKNYLDAKAVSLENVFFAGDMNLYGDFEPAHNTILNGGLVKLFDPINLPGLWHANSSFSAIHTQSPRNVLLPDGGSNGGLDDRFDWIFTSQDALNGTNKVKYIPNSYEAIGNDGLHFNKSITDAPVNISVTPNVLSALFYMSDHLPVAMKVEIGNNVTVGIEQQVNISSWKGFFANNQFNFQSKNPESLLNVTVFDLVGRMVYTNKFNSTNSFIINLSNLTNGLYFVYVNSEKTQETFKIIKEK